MPDLDKLQQHIDAMSALLKEREYGISSWAMMLGQHWKAVAEMWDCPEWTTEPPTVEGLYFAKHKKGDGPMWVYFDGKEVLHFDYEGAADVSDFSHWLGPIPEPGPPK